MKVILEDRRLVEIGKDIPLDKVDAESIGLIYFREDGPDIFKRFLKDAMRYPDASRLWYLSVIDRIAAVIPVMTCDISGLSWCEVDYPKDLKQAEKVVSAIRLSSEISADQDTVLQGHARQVS
jgi:choline kinase